MNYQLGDKIRIESTLKRRSEWLRIGDSSLEYERKFWKEEKLRNPIDGIVVGVRNLSNGKNEYLQEYGNVYEPKEHFKALIVAYNIFRKPILVRIQS